MFKLSFTLIAVLVSSLFVSSSAHAIDLGDLLDEIMDRDAIAKFPSPSYICRQASSYDRDSDAGPEDPGLWFANDDWSNFLRFEITDGRTEWVMMDVDGPGAIVRWWITGFDFDGTIRVYIDGATVPVLQGKADELIGGTIIVGSPLSAERSRGRNLYLPIPYSQHCKITYDGANPHQTGDFNDNLYYNINYRTYASGTLVTSFTAADLATYASKINTVQTDLLVPDSHTGTIDNTVTNNMGVALNRVNEIQLTGPAAIRELIVKITSDDMAKALRGCWLEISFDGELTVQVPVGDFFGSGLGLNPYKGWWCQVESDGTMVCYWPMPFQTEATVRLVNRGELPAQTEMTISTCPWIWDGNSMYYHSNFKSQNNIPTASKSDWNYIEATGKGIYVGDSLAVYNPTTTWWGEGDEKIYVDGEAFPSHFGTGSEDYYGYAWCDPTFFEAPFHAQPQAEGPANFGNVTNTRTRGLDGVPFNTSIKTDIEIWHWASVDVDYAVTTYWYARGGASSNIALLVDPVTMDTFDDTALKTGWLWQDSDEDDNYSLTERPGYFRMKLSSGGEDTWLNVNAGSPLLLTDTPNGTGRYAIETSVDLATANNDTVLARSLAGIVLFDSGNNLNEHPYDLRFIFGPEPDERGLCVEVQLPGSNLGYVTLPGDTTVAHLRLERDSINAEWVAFYKLSELDEWTELMTVRDSQLPGGESSDLSIGLIGMTWGNVPENINGANFDFDYFKIVPFCGSWGYHPADANRDCYVNLEDLMIMATGWMECTHPEDTDCRVY